MECVYFADDEETAAIEYERQGSVRFPFVTYYAKVRLTRVLDLTDPKTLSVLGLRNSDLKVAWRGARTPTTTQFLGQAVNQQAGISSIRFPSDTARERGLTGANVVIVRNCVRRPD